MKTIEYRVVELPEAEGDVRLKELLDMLSELGTEGWEVASVDLTPHPAFLSAPLQVLMQRTVEAEVGAASA